MDWFKFHRGYLVRKRPTIEGFDVTVWEPWTKRRDHSVKIFHGGKCWGLLGTGELPEEIASLRLGSPERENAVKFYRQTVDHRIRILSARAFPSAGR